jgi:hypothetical protein
MNIHSLLPRCGVAMILGIPYQSKCLSNFNLEAVFSFKLMHVILFENTVFSVEYMPFFIGYFWLDK